MIDHLQILTPGTKAENPGHLSGTFFGVLLLFFFLGCSDQNPAGSPSQNSVKKQNESPTRIISLAPSITEVLLALNAGDRIVGVTKHGPDVPELNHAVRIGGFTNMNSEVLLRENPDLVLVKEDIHREQKQKLNDLGVPTKTVKQNSIEQVLSSVRRIGNLLGEEKKADELTGKLSERVEQIRKATSARKKPRVIVVMHSSHGSGRINHVNIAGQGTFLSDVIQTAGGQNAYTGDVPWPEISAEGLIKMKPDVIFELIPDLEKKPFTKEEIHQDWNSLSTIPAVKSNRFHVLTGDYLLHPGPYVIRTLERIARKLHPEIDWDQVLKNEIVLEPGG